MALRRPLMAVESQTDAPVSAPRTIEAKIDSEISKACGHELAVVGTIRQMVLELLAFTGISLYMWTMLMFVFPSLIACGLMFATRCCTDVAPVSTVSHDLFVIIGGIFKCFYSFSADLLSIGTLGKVDLSIGMVNGTRVYF